jgi:hypothetical protein
MGGSPPTVSPTGYDSLEFNASGTYTSNNDLGTFGVYNTTFDAGNGTTNLTGGEIDLSWPLTGFPPAPTFSNLSTNPVTINNNVTFVTNAAQDGGTEETFNLAQGSTTTFNGSVNVNGGSQLIMTNGQIPGTSPTGGTMIWTQPTTFTNSPSNGISTYFPIRIKEGTFEMAGYTVDNGTSDAPVVNIDGVNTLPGGGVNNGCSASLYIGPDDTASGGGPGSLDVVAFYLIAAGDACNWGPEIGNAGTTTIGGLNTSGTVTFNDFFHSVNTTDQHGAGQTIYYSAATGGTVLQNFQMINGSLASIDKIGGGTWIIAGGGENPTATDGQAFSGTTTVRDGTLELAYDDTGTNYVTLPAAVLSSPGGTYFASGDIGGSLGFNAPTNANVQLDTNAVQLGDSGTLPTDNIALLTSYGGGYSVASPNARQVLHNISVNNDNPSGTTSIGVADNSTADFTGNILLYKSVVLASGTGGTANFTGNITGTGAITANGTGTVNLSGVNTYNGATNVTSGAALVIAAAGALPSGSTIVNNGSLTVNGNVVTGNISGTGTLNIGAASTTVLKLASGSLGSSQNALSIATGSTLDISNNHMYINYGSGPDPILTIAAYIKSGYNGGGWNGPGIISSAAQIKTNGLAYGVGFADGKDGKVSGLTSGQIEVKYTLLGDANLDGLVNAADFTILAANFNQTVTAWDQGDFNYDGLVNAADFTDLAANFNQSVSGADVSAGDVAALDAFAAANGLSLPTSSVPEPATAGLICMVGVGLLHRRRRA